MPQFKYKAVSLQKGETFQGVIDAISKESAIIKLQSAGYLPVSAEEIRSGNWFDLIRSSFWRQQNKITQKELNLITRELATLLEAGLPLDNALRILSQLDLAPPAQRLLQNLLQEIQSGASLSAALAAQSGVFDNLYINMIKAGEASGALDVVTKRLADFLERMSELRASVITALIYPAVLVGFSILSLIVLMLFVVPEFVLLFDDANYSLPWLTRVVFSFSALFQQYWWALLCLFVILFWSIDKCLSNAAFRLRFDRWRLNLPYIGVIIKQMEMARFARTLGTAVTNGVPLLTGIGLVKELINNRFIARIVSAMATNLEQGQSMTKPLKDSGVCPDLAVQLIEIGEESGQLETMLIKIADICDNETRTVTKRLLTILEPILILILGGLIALIIIAVLQAVLSMNELVI